MEVGVRRFSGATDGNRIALKQSFQITSGVGRSAPRPTLHKLHSADPMRPVSAWEAASNQPPSASRAPHQVRTDCFLLRQLQLAQRAVADVVIHDVPARVIQEGARTVFAALRELVKKVQFPLQSRGFAARATGWRTDLCFAVGEMVTSLAG